MKSPLWNGSITIGLCLLVPMAAWGAARPPVKTFLQQKAQFSSSQLATLDGGQPVTQVLKTTDKTEVAVMGVVRVDVPRTVFLQGSRDVRRFMNTGPKMAILSKPPVLSEFNGVSVPPDDVKELQKCKPGDCKIKLPLKRMDEFRGQVNWNAPDPAAEVDVKARQALFEGFSAYLKQGSAAFAPMVDKGNPVSLDAQFHGLLQNTPALLAYYPELHGYLENYPQGSLPGSTNLFYWAEEDFGLRPTLTVNQVVAYAPAGTEDAVVARKQIYASHYFNGFLTLTIYAKDPDASYVVMLERARLDGITGRMGGVYRGKIQKGLEQKLGQGLAAMKQQLQAAR